MSASQFDPAGWMANLLGGGPLRQAADGSPAAEADPAAAPESLQGALATMVAQAASFQQEWMRQATAFWANWPTMMTGGPGDAAAKSDSDKRFASDAWRSDPRFDVLRKSYLAYADLLQGSVERLPVDDKTRAQARYGMRQFVDAMSPSNFFMTNPDAMQLAQESGGQSVLDGMNLFFQDLAKGRVTTTDEEAFEVGRNIATSPGAVVFENDLVQLIQYAPVTGDVHERPIVMIPPCINKYYIMDLQPENSLVGYVRDQGHTVFMVSWRNVGPELGRLRWDDYLEQGVMRAIDVAREICGVDRVNTLGFCVGGTLLSSALAVLGARGDERAASMTLLTTLLDFSDTGEIGALVTEQSVAGREQTIGRGGLMEGRELSFAFTSLRANDLMWQYVVNGYLKGKGPPAFDMLHWNADQTNLPGPMFCWYVRNCYLENNLRVAGKTTLCGEPVDLSRVDVPTFLYASREDHIVPWRTAYLSNDLLGGETTFVLGASGHIAGVINSPRKTKRNYWIDGAKGPDPMRWLETATNIPGSWWPAWARWLEKFAGDRVAARSELGSRKYEPIEPAPGRYVLQKA
ncbi:MAG TPA: class I poly(R)-hydroxyalkanoic acid synthase [Burkholderiaceae bacterium]|nr:class I poly(R)-hydroxyalkanoic acid synthase [Burkholderiaceae bacterium]